MKLSALISLIWPFFYGVDFGLISQLNVQLLALAGSDLHRRIIYGFNGSARWLDDVVSRKSGCHPAAHQQ